MNKGITTIILVILLIGCSNKKNSFESIELMSYNWSRYNDTTQQEVLPFLKCYTYFKVNPQQNAKLYRYFGFPKPKSEYYYFKLRKGLMDSIFSSADCIDTIELKEINSEPQIYDGPILKLRISYPNKPSRVISFYDYDDRPNVKILLDFYHSLKSEYSNNSSHITLDSVDIEKSKNDFMEFCKQYDPKHFYFPPPPSLVDSISMTLH